MHAIEAGVIVTHQGVTWGYRKIVDSDGAHYITYREVGGPGFRWVSLGRPLTFYPEDRRGQ